MPPVEVSLFGAFRFVVAGQEVRLPDTGAHIIAYICLTPRRQVHRDHLAELLWPDRPRDRGMANLRAALWRLPAAVRAVVHSSRGVLSLQPDMTIDTDLLDRPPETLAPLLDRLSAPLLPGWYDEWVLVERERLEMRRIEALERLAWHRLGSSMFAEAIDIALTALASEPYRESLHRVIIEAHIGERNYSEARRHLGWLTSLLASELGVAPSSATRGLLARIP